MGTEETINGTSLTMKSRKWEVLLAGALGAFFAGLGDWLTNKGGSIVAELERLLELPGGEISSLMLMGLAGATICWVFHPDTKIDGFARGLAILTVIGIPTKNQITDKQPETSSSYSAPVASDKWLASMALTDVNLQANPDCPSDGGRFLANATIVQNEWISSTKPEVRWPSTDIFVTKCGNTLAPGQRVQKLDSYETPLKGFYYIKVRYQENGVTRIGWIYSGRNPNFWQQVKPDVGVVN